jgi:hypothetical protein
MKTQFKIIFFWIKANYNQLFIIFAIGYFLIFQIIIRSLFNF